MKVVIKKSQFLPQDIRPIMPTDELNVMSLEVETHEFFMRLINSQASRHGDGRSFDEKIVNDRINATLQRAVIGAGAAVQSSGPAQ